MAHGSTCCASGVVIWVVYRITAQQHISDWKLIRQVLRACSDEMVLHLDHTLLGTFYTCLRNI